MATLLQSTNNCNNKKDEEVEEPPAAAEPEQQEEVDEGWSLTGSLSTTAFSLDGDGESVVSVAAADDQKEEAEEEVVRQEAVAAVKAELKAWTDGYLAARLAQAQREEEAKKLDARLGQLEAKVAAAAVLGDVERLSRGVGTAVKDELERLLTAKFDELTAKLEPLVEATVEKKLGFEKEQKAALEKSEEKPARAAAGVGGGLLPPSGFYRIRKPADGGTLHLAVYAKYLYVVDRPVSAQPSSVFELVRDAETDNYYQLYSRVVAGDKKEEWPLTYHKYNSDYITAGFGLNVTGDVVHSQLELLPIATGAEAAAGEGGYTVAIRFPHVGRWLAFGDGRGKWEPDEYVQYLYDAPTAAAEAAHFWLEPVPDDQLQALLL